MIGVPTLISFQETFKAWLVRRGEIERSVVAGVNVGAVALPLAMALAIKTLAGPGHGLNAANGIAGALERIRK